MVSLNPSALASFATVATVAKVGAGNLLQIDIQEYCWHGFPYENDTQY